MHRIQQVAVATLFTAALAAPAAAQQQNYSPVSQADIQRLQDNVYQAAMDIQQLRGRDATRATQLQSQLDDLREEVIYLKVKLRKDGTLGRSEYSTVRDRIEDVRSQAHGETEQHRVNVNGRCARPLNRHRDDDQHTVFVDHTLHDVDEHDRSRAPATLKFRWGPRSTCG